MTTEERIDAYIEGTSEPKRTDVRRLHDLILRRLPGCKKWFHDGLSDAGKVVSNPNIGYGSYLIKYADGSSKEFYRIGLTATKGGISVYILGLQDRSFLRRTYGDALGKAKVSGYCVNFKTLEDIDTDVLLSAIRHGYDAKS